MVLMNGRCPLLTQDGLCPIVTELGEEFLSTTCHTHPRFTEVYGGYQETMLSVSCPEAARLLLDRTERIENFYEKLCSHTFNRELKVQKYSSKEYPGYSYIKIYNANAAKEHMMKYLTAMLKVDQVVTFGTIPNKYDVVVEGNDINQVVRTLHSMYEPLPWSRYAPSHFRKNKEQICNTKK